MDLSAALTAEQAGALADPESTLEEASRVLDRHELHTLHIEEGSFEKSLRLKNTLDEYERLAKSDPSWARLAILINCEYRLYKLNENTPLRYNPFLSHWVEALLRLEPIANSPTPESLNPDGTLGRRESSLVRSEVIKTILSNGGASGIAWMSPKTLYQQHIQQQHRLSFDIELYVRILEEEGIYEKRTPPGSTGSVSAGSEQPGESLAPTYKKSVRASASTTWQQDLLNQLEEQPDVAVQAIARLPVEIPYLDFLTMLIQDPTLQGLLVEPNAVIRDYLQHALRQAEQMGQPLSQVGTESSSGSPRGGGNEDGITGGGIGHGREVQARAVKLLLLFIRNFIRKALIPPEDIYFEIQEICVRYVWIKEVREFRAFIEEGTSGD